MRVHQRSFAALYFRTTNSLFLCVPCKFVERRITMSELPSGCAIPIAPGRQMMVSQDQNQEGRKRGSQETICRLGHVVEFIPAFLTSCLPAFRPLKPTCVRWG